MKRRPQVFDEGAALAAIIAHDDDALGRQVLALARHVACHLAPPRPSGGDWRDDEGAAIERGWAACASYQPELGSVRNYLTTTMVRAILDLRRADRRRDAGMVRYRAELGDRDA